MSRESLTAGKGSYSVSPLPRFPTAGFDADRAESAPCQVPSPSAITKPRGDIRGLPSLWWHDALVPAAGGIKWFQVTWDDEAIHLRVRPRLRRRWRAAIRWDSISRVCFKAENLLLSDGIYIFTTTRPESYVIPTEAVGGSDLWEELLKRRLFDPSLAIEAMAATSEIFCWPPAPT